MLGEPIWVRTLSSHCRGPLRCSSIQQGVLVTVCRLQERRGGGERGKNEHKCDLQNFTNVKRFYSYRSILSCLDNSLACGAKGTSLSSLTCSWPMLPASSTPDLFSLHLLSQRKNSLYDLLAPQISANRKLPEEKGGLLSEQHSSFILQASRLLAG